MKQFFSLVLTSAVLLLFGAGCAKEPTAIQLSPASLSLTEGESAGITAKVLPEDARYMGITWTSSNAKVATVSNGRVTAVGVGSATITASTEGVSGTASVTVKAKTVNVTGVTLDKTTLELTEGESQTLKATVAPENATDKSVTWSSSATNIATVDANGKVTAVAAGTATITVKTNDGGKTATCAVTVKAKIVSVAGVSLDKTTLELTEGESQTLKATVAPENATDKSVTWSSSATNIATVDANGKVTAVAAGTATITVKTNDGGKTATCALTVNAIPLESLAVNPSKLEIKEGEDKQLEVVFTPANFGNKSVQWASDNVYVASVDKNGLVHAVKPGNCKIYVESQADKTKQAYCEVTVTPDPTLKGISFPYTTLALKQGETKELLVIFDPEYASNKNVSWKTSNPSVATVSDKGVVTAVWNGEADITATSQEGGFTATCKITVTQEAGAQVYVKAGRYFLNGEPYTGRYDDLMDVYSDGANLYECYMYDGIYKNGSLLTRVYSSGTFMGEIGGRIYYLDNYAIHIYDIETRAELFGGALSSDFQYRNEAMAVAADGTAYVAGTSQDAFGRKVGRLWTVSRDFTITETTLYNGGSEETGVDVALDGDGNVWVLTEGDVLNLYKNGEFVRVVSEFSSGNTDNYLTFKGSDLYIISSGRSGKEITVYKNTNVLYKLTPEYRLSASSKPLFSKSGDLYFGAESLDTNQSYVYKNGELLYTMDSWHIYRMSVLN